MWTLVQEYQPKVFGTASAFKAILQMENTFLWLIHFFSRCFSCLCISAFFSRFYFSSFIVFWKVLFLFPCAFFLYVCHSGMLHYIRVRKKHFHFPSTLYHTDSQNMHSHTRSSTRMDKYCVHFLPQNESKLMNFHGKKVDADRKKTSKRNMDEMVVFFCLMIGNQPLYAF